MAKIKYRTEMTVLFRMARGNFFEIWNVRILNINRITNKIPFYEKKTLKGGFIYELTSLTADHVIFERQCVALVDQVLPF